MGIRRLHTLLLALAGVMLGHMVGYAAAHPSHASRELALVGHGYMGPLAAVVVPAGVLAVLGAAIRSVRRNGRGLPTARGLMIAQVAIFLLQELLERVPGPGSPLSAAGERGVWAGVVAQVLIAWAVARLVRWTAIAVQQVLWGPRRVVLAGPVLVPARGPELAEPSSEVVGRLPRRRGPPAVVNRVLTPAGPVVRPI